MDINCSSFWPNTLAHSTHLVVVISLIAVVTVTSNFTLIYILVKTNQTHRNTFRFILAMNASDVLHGAFVMPAIAVAISLRDTYQSCLFDQATHYGDYLFGYFSYFMLMCIAFDRLHQIRKMRVCASNLTSFQANAAILTCFLLSNVASYVGVRFISFRFQLSLTIINICLISSVFIAYSMLLHKVKVHNISVTKRLANTNFRGAVPIKLENNATKTVWMLLINLIIAYLPFNITTPWLSYYKYEKKENPGPTLSLATMWAYVMIFAYCTINSCIFAYGNSRIRHFIAAKMTGVIHNGELPPSRSIAVVTNQSMAVN